jgi:predicted AAA+ superfamily ATPase
MISRIKDLQIIQKLIVQFPVTAILGARQCGKTTIARQIHSEHYFDLENPADLATLENPQLALGRLRGLVVIDEVQRRPELFALLRVLADEPVERKFLILGSASGELVRQSSESLAGRIGYHYLGGLRLWDVGVERVEDLWLRGGFPRAFTAGDMTETQRWLEQFISTFLERDIPQLGISIPSASLRRFWMMLCHYHGQIFNAAEMAASFGVSNPTIRRYLEILCGTFMTRTLQPWYANIGKRQVKRPKVYLRDSGVALQLLSISSMEELLRHNKLGSLWEGFALETSAAAIGKRDHELFFWKVHSGSELDLVWQEHGTMWGIEFKYSDAPTLTASMKEATDILKLRRLWVVYPGTRRYELNERTTVLPLTEIGAEWRYEV